MNVRRIRSRWRAGDVYKRQVAALGIAHDYAQQLRAVDAGGDEHVHDAVIGPGVVRGVESAAVVAPVADADQVEFRPAGEPLGDGCHGLLDALHIVDGEADDVARSAADDGQAAVLVHIGADSRVDAEGADVDGVAVVALYDVERPDLCLLYTSRCV